MYERLPGILGLAVDAGKVAAVGDRDPQIVNTPIIGVMKRHGKLYHSGAASFKVKSGAKPPIENAFQHRG
jgi:hypothetical protein